MLLPEVITVGTIEIKHVRHNAIGIVLHRKEEDTDVVEPVYGIMKQQVYELHEALAKIIESNFKESG